jgi:hypothetical protein
MFWKEVNMATYKELLRTYKRKAKLADDYMRRLEKLSKEDRQYRGVLQFSYARARRDIDPWSGKDAKRFDTKPPRTKQGLEAKIRDIERFLESPTSTKRGIKKYYQERAKTMSERYGVSANWEDMHNFYSRGIFEEMDRRFGSRTALVAFGKIQKNAREIKKALKESSVDKYVASEFDGEDLPVRRAIESMLSDYKGDLRKAGVKV